MLERLAPDLIVTQELCSVCAVSYDIVDRAARRLGSDPHIVSLEPSSLDDVFATIAFLGELTSREAEATALVRGLRDRVARLKSTAAPNRPTVLVLEWTEPPMSAGHWTPGLIELAGGTPLLAHPGQNSRALAWDDIVAADPAHIVVGPCGYDLEKTRDAIDELARSVPQWSALRAVQNGSVHPIDGNAYMNRPGPRLVDTAELIRDALLAAETR
ncbi:MAG TPA: ABC transporter substrate-binding protein [Candidatus Aquilonibacter sp.]|nr:ABC transporter substrate-binding protein [Candidatus Aquilonibacter sp.]